MTIYVNPSLYNPEAIVDTIVADSNAVVLMDAFSSDYATVVANGIFQYSPAITKAAHTTGFKAVVAAASNQTESTNSGDVNHWAIIDTDNSVVLHVGEGTGETITAGDPFNAPTVAAKFPDMVASA